MDAITMLKEDHKTVEQLFKRFEKAGDRAFAEKRKIADQVVEALSKHAAIEEQVFYPVARATVPDTEDVVLESLEEHHIVKWVLSELDGMDPTDERFDAKMTVLMENVRHHVKEEEQEFFPKVRAELDRNALAELGQAMETAKEMAPSHPHPRSPDTPPGNLAAAASAGVVDRIGDTVSGVAQGSVERGAGPDRPHPRPSEAVGARRPGRRWPAARHATSAAAPPRSPTMPSPPRYERSGRRRPRPPARRRPPARPSTAPRRRPARASKGAKRTATTARARPSGPPRRPSAARRGGPPLRPSAPRRPVRPAPARRRRRARRPVALRRRRPPAS